MSNSSSLFKAQILNYVVAGILAVHLVEALVTNDLDFWDLAVMLGAVLALVAVYFQRRGVTAVNQAAAACARVAGGDFEARIVGITEGGELGRLLNTVNNTIDRTDAFVREAGAAMEYVSRNRYYRRIIERGLLGSFRDSARIINNATDAMEKRTTEFKTSTDIFETSIKHVVETVASASTELQSTAGVMEESASTTSQQAQAVATAATDASSNVQTVASAAEELSSSIQEISSQVGQSAQIASDAATKAQRTNEVVQGLANAAQKIGEVVSLITDIANQTNLLALNATIEAARAGEAGKGFAVVASEVKNLANQTAKATEEISGQIGGIQNATNEAVDAIREISQIIGQVNEIASAIAAAVEEQGAATKEIARNVEQASSGTQEVTSHINDVTKAAGETGQAAGQVLEAASELSRQAEHLRGEVDTFLVALRKVV